MHGKALALDPTFVMTKMNLSTDTSRILPEVSSQCMSTSAVAGVAVTAVLVLLVVAVVQCAVIWHLRR